MHTSQEKETILKNFFRNHLPECGVFARRKSSIALLMKVQIWRTISLGVVVTVSPSGEFAVRGKVVVCEREGMSRSIFCALFTDFPRFGVFSGFCW